MFQLYFSAVRAVYAVCMVRCFVTLGFEGAALP